MDYEKNIFIPVIAATFFTCCQIQYPEKKGNVIEDYRISKVADPYRWLEDDNSEETKAWVDDLFCCSLLTLFQELMMTC